MKTRKEEFVTRLEALFHEYLTGKTCLAIYDMARKTDWRIRRLAPMFYNVVLRSTLLSAVLSAHKIYSNDTASLKTFLQLAEKSAAIFRQATEQEVQAEIRKTRAQIAAFEDTIRRLAIRRNNGIGHLTEEIVLNKVRIENKMEMTFGEVPGLLDYSAQTLNTFNRMWNGEASLTHIAHNDDYKRLVNILIEQQNTEIQRHNEAYPFDLVRDKIEPFQP